MGNKSLSRLEAQRDEHDALLSDFMGKVDGERLQILRSWRFWEEAMGAAAQVWTKIEDQGLSEVTDDDMARLYMVEARRVGQRPSVRARALGEIGKMRVQRLRDELNRVRRESREEYARLQKDFRAAKRSRKSAVEALEKNQRDLDKIVEEAIQEDRKRQSEVKGRLS